MLDEEGYAVDVAIDGIEGLSKATTWTYDAVVLDLMLPKMDGWRLMERLRESNKVPVLILSARDAIQDRVRGLDVGADDYLPKPFERVELMARLRALIRRSAGQTISMIRIDDIQIDMRCKQVQKSGSLVSLTAREYSLLEYLVMHRGKVVDRRELFDHLFDEVDDPASNILDVYVSYLRRKLGAKLIETRRGQGYVVK